MDGMDGSVEASFGVLDLLLLAVENLKLLIGLPAVVGVMVYAATFLIPREHVSHAILALPASVTMVGGAAATATFAQTPNQAAALMVSAVVLDPVIESMGLVGDRSLPEVRLALADDVDANIGADGFLHLLVTRKDPREALVISNAIIDSWLKTTLPLESERLEKISEAVLVDVDGKVLVRTSQKAAARNAKEYTNPLFIDPAAHRGLITFGAMALTIALITAVYCLLLCAFAQAVSTQVRAHRRLAQALERLAGLFLIGFGIRLGTQ